MIAIGPIVAHDATLEPVDAANTEPDVIVASPRLAGIPYKKRLANLVFNNNSFRIYIWRHNYSH